MRMDHFRNVAKYKQRIAGKSIPIEKYCVRKAEKYFNNGGRLVLPAFELMLVWNWFNIVAKRRDLLENIYAQIVAKTEELQKRTCFRYILISVKFL